MNIMTHDSVTALPFYIPSDFGSFVQILDDLPTIAPLKLFDNLQYLANDNSSLI